MLLHVIRLCVASESCCGCERTGTAQVFVGCSDAHSADVQVYEAVSCMSQRQLKRAANLLLDSVATFTTYELFSYEQCVFYAVSMAIVTLPRPELRKKV